MYTIIIYYSMIIDYRLDYSKINAMMYTILITLCNIGTVLSNLKYQSNKINLLLLLQ